MNCECTPLQASFLEELRASLRAFKTISSEETRLSSEEQVVIDYVYKFINTDSTMVDHLHEHLKQLYETEKLISSPNLLDNAKQLAIEALSLNKATLLNTRRYSSFILQRRESVFKTSLLSRQPL